MKLFIQRLKGHNIVTLYLICNIIIIHTCRVALNSGEQKWLPNTRLRIGVAPQHVYDSGGSQNTSQINYQFKDILNIAPQLAPWQEFPFQIIIPTQPIKVRVEFHNPILKEKARVHEFFVSP